MQGPQEVSGNLVKLSMGRGRRQKQLKTNYMPLGPSNQNKGFHPAKTSGATTQLLDAGFSNADEGRVEEPVLHSPVERTQNTCKTPFSTFPLKLTLSGRTFRRIFKTGIPSSFPRNNPTYQPGKGNVGE